MKSNQSYACFMIRVHFPLLSCFSIRRSHLPISTSGEVFILVLALPYFFHLLQTIHDSTPLREFCLRSTPNPLLVSTATSLSSSLPHRCSNLFISNELDCTCRSLEIHLSATKSIFFHPYHPPSISTYLHPRHRSDRIAVGNKTLSRPARLKEYWKSAD